MVRSKSDESLMIFEYFYFSCKIVEIAARSIFQRVDFMKLVEDEIYNVNEDSSSNILVDGEPPSAKKSTSKSQDKSTKTTSKN